MDKNQNGSQILTSEVSYNVNTLITGGDYDEDRNLLALVSYNSNGNQYLLLFENFKLNNLENTEKYTGKISRINGSVNTATQTITVFIEIINIVKNKLWQQVHTEQ